MYNVLDIAHKILNKATQTEFEEPISNLKLQKLLYYMQGFHLAYFDTPLFKEEIEAWMYGPVVPCVYNHFKINENRGIIYSKEVISLNSEEEKLFDEVYHVYNSYSAIGLMNLTHSETPWKTTPTGLGSIIEKSKLKSFFKKKLK
jgi:uncharacterized phage-associated protein